MNQPYPLTREYQGISYSLLATPDAEQARFAFSGSFENEQIIWDATLLTLTRYHEIQPDAGQPVTRSAFLEIGGNTAHGRAMRVALDIALIDEAAILRTIVMIRNYKRLRPGRHDFGEPRVFPSRAAGRRARNKIGCRGIAWRPHDTAVPSPTGQRPARRSGGVRGLPDHCLRRPFGRHLRRIRPHAVARQSSLTMSWLADTAFRAARAGHRARAP